MEFLVQPWPWYVSGPMLALIMVLLLFSGGDFGVSSSLRTICSMTGAGKKYQFFDFDWKGQIWNIIFLLGAIIGGYIASEYMVVDHVSAQVSAATIEELKALGISDAYGALPEEIISWESLATLEGFIAIVGGGFLIGFGARYAGGCTSGHAISGLSNFQLPSLIAVVGFFVGGLLMTFIFMPILMK